MKFVIIGVGQFGRALARYLSEKGHEVTILDEKESVIEELQDIATYSLIGDATDIRVLRQLDLVGDDIYVIVAVGEQFERNLLISAQLKELGVKKLYVRSVNDLHTKVLRLIGIGELFRVEDVAARQLADRFMSDMMSLRKLDATHALADVPLPHEWVGHRLRDVNLRAIYHLNLLTVRRGQARDAVADDVLVQPEQPVIDTPEPDMEFQEGDVLVLFGKETDLKKFAEHFSA